MSLLKISQNPQGLRLPEGQHLEGRLVPLPRLKRENLEAEPSSPACSHCPKGPRQRQLSVADSRWLVACSAAPGLEESSGGWAPPRLGLTNSTLSWVPRSCGVFCTQFVPSHRPITLDTCFGTGSALGPFRNLSPPQGIPVLNMRIPFSFQLFTHQASRFVCFLEQWGYLHPSVSCPSAAGTLEGSPTGGVCRFL